ncbi:MAG TPA: GerMN domain-containing protein [Thermoanaerobaculia bacterium]
MNRRAASFILGLALALLLGGAVWWFLAGRGGGSVRGAGPAAVGGPTEKVVFNVYFAADGGRLRGEPRELDVTEAPKDRIHKILAALLSGPNQPGLYPLFPKEKVTVGSVQLDGDGTAYVDLRWPEQPDPPASGSTEEMQRVYAIVNSVVLNVPEASRVVLLWNGFQRESFSGHLDMSRPLPPDRTLIAP